MTQFVVIGSGLPNQRNVHQVAQEIVPDTRVVYVSNDPVVLSHARAMLATNPYTGVVEGDVMHPGELLADPELLRLIDLDVPVAVLILSALQFIPDEDDPHKSVAILARRGAGRQPLRHRPRRLRHAPGRPGPGGRDLPAGPRPRRGRLAAERAGAALLRRAGPGRPRPGLRAPLAPRQPAQPRRAATRRGRWAGWPASPGTDPAPAARAGPARPRPLPAPASELPPARFRDPFPHCPADLPARFREPSPSGPALPSPPPGDRRARRPPGRASCSRPRRTAR